MGYHPRIETSEYADFLTSRSRNSELWFVNNKPLEDAVLGYAAKYSQRYNVSLYAFAIEGNHTQKAAQFHEQNRAHFMRDFKSSVARAVPRHTSHEGGTFWGRRYSNEFLPAEDDIENWFFYTVLQPVQDGLVEKISDYPGYNCFHDAIWGIKKKFKVMNWTEYYKAKRWNKSQKKIIRKTDFEETYVLEYKRLPGYEDLTQKEYAHLMLEKLEARRQKIVAERYANGKGFAGREKLEEVEPGARPKKTKTSDIYSHRPRVLCVCAVRRAEALNWYFTLYNKFKEASEDYRLGKPEVEFPPGMYKPPLFTVH